MMTNFLFFSMSLGFDKVSVLSLQLGFGGGLDFAKQDSKIFMLDSNTTLCRAQYYAKDGLSGSGVVTEVRGGEVKVIGVHYMFQRMIRQSQVSQLREQE